MAMPSLPPLSRREKTLLCLMLGMLVLMYLSHKPETYGVSLTLTFSWTALGLFFGMLGVLIFMPDK